MQKVKIVTQSGCDLTFEDAQEHGILMLPDYLIYQGREYRNNIDIKSEDFYGWMDEDSALPTTSHPSPGDFMSAFLSCEDCEAILCIVMSANMTSTRDTALMAAEMLRDDGFKPDIHIFDSQQVSYGMGIAVLEAAEMAKAGADVNDIIARLNFLADHVTQYFTVTTLKYAAKGGRISTIKARAADLLSLHPLMIFKHGAVDNIAILNSFNRSVSEIHKRFQTEFLGEGRVFIFHADNESVASTLLDSVRKDYPNTPVSLRSIGPAVGLYTGRGCVGISFVGKGKK